MNARIVRSGAVRLAVLASALMISSACGSAASHSTAVSPSTAASPNTAASPSSGKADGVGFHDGTYETKISAEDVKDRPQDAGCPCTWGFILDDGSFKFDDPNERPTRVEFLGDHMTLPDWNMGHGIEPAITVRWVYDEQSQAVTFSEMAGGTDDDRFVFERTWVKVD